MRALSRLPRGFPANPRVLHRRPTLPRPEVCQRSRIARLNSSSSSGNDREKRGDAGTSEPSTGSSNSWTASRTLLVSALAAGLSYAYAISSNKSQPESLKQPQYGSTQDLKKVGTFIELLFNVYVTVYKKIPLADASCTTRPLPNYEPNWAMKLLAQMRMTFRYMDSQSGLVSMRTGSLLLSRIQRARRTSRRLPKFATNTKCQ